MMLRLAATLTMALLASPALSQDHPMHLLKEPWIKAKWSHAIKGSGFNNSWVGDLSGVASAPETMRDASGKSWTVAELCQPHDCADNKLAVIIDRQNRNLWGLLLKANPTSRRYFGNPGPEEKALLEAAFRGSLANVGSRSTGVVAAEQDDGEVLLNTPSSEPPRGAPTQAAAQSVPAAPQGQPPREQQASWRYGNHALFGLSAHIDADGESFGLACGFRGVDLMRGDSVLVRMTRGLSPESTKPMRGLYVVEGRPGAGGSVVFENHPRGFLQLKSNACGIIQDTQRGRAILFPDGVFVSLEVRGKETILTLTQRGIEKQIRGDGDLHKLVDTKRVPLTGAAKAIRQLVNACPAIRADFRNDCGAH